MPISIQCSNCDKTLKAPDSAAGKKIRCPSCKSVIEVPPPEVEVTEIEADDAPPRVAKKPAVVESVKEKPPPIPRKGRKDEEEDDDDRAEDEDDEEERKPKRKKKKKRYDDDDDDDDFDDDIRKRAKPHRGTTVLVLGILSIPSACLCPIIAWVLAAIANNMANADIPLMEKGKMDPEGLGNTKTGKICAIIGAVLGTINAIAGIALRFMN